jgi:ParB/RepB/Spo0J family partition protein
VTTAIAEPPKKLAPPPPIPADAGSPSVNIPVSRIVPSPWNRKADVDDLVESVRKNGVVQNVVLRPHKATEEDVALYCMKSDPFAVGDSIYQLVAGERRWGAAKKAGRTHVPAAIRQLSDIDAMDFQIDENENRKNLRPMERAEAYDRLRMLYQEAHAKDKDYTEAKAIEAVAASRNCSSRTVYDIISLKKLTQNVQHALRNGELETSHGVVLAGRSQEEQEKILLWIRQQTHHSQGDIPSVRRLKDEIRRADIAAEDKKRQVKLLFREGEQKEAAPATPAVRFDVGFDGKRVDLIRGAPLPISVQGKLLKVYPGLTTAHFLNDCRVQLAIGLNGKPFYLTVNELQNVLTTGIPYSPAYPPQTPAPPKAPTAAELKAAEKQREKEGKTEEQRRAKEAKAERERERNRRIDASYQAEFFQALATKSHVCSRMLTHVVPNLIYEVWNNQLPIEAFGQSVLGWPPPKDGHAYSYNEVRAHCVKHTRKFGAKGVLPALLITLYENPPNAEKLAKYFGVDPKKLRKKAAAQIVKEECIARLPKVPTTKKEKQLHAIVRGNDPAWNKLRRTGASDVEIRKVLCALLPNDGGHGSKELGDVYAKSGNDMPRVWFDTMHPQKKAPSLQGLQLISAVRDLLKIPEKGDVDA